MLYDERNAWNFALSMFFLGVVAICMSALAYAGNLPTTISLFDATLIILATFRLTRLITYDKIMLWFRDLFMKVEAREGDRGEFVVLRQAHPRGLLRTVSELLGCPWCFGVWAAFMISFFYFLTPLAWYPIFALAVAGVASFLLLAANLIGWHAEHKKFEHERARDVVGQ